MLSKFSARKSCSGQLRLCRSGELGQVWSVRAKDASAKSAANRLLPPPSRQTSSLMTDESSHWIQTRINVTRHGKQHIGEAKTDFAGFGGVGPKTWSG